VNRKEDEAEEREGGRKAGSNAATQIGKDELLFFLPIRESRQ
jgi:hypothetical protein